MGKYMRVMAVAVLALALANSAKAYTVNYSSGDLSASAEFVVNGVNLEVTLTNTSLNDALVPTDILTGVFFTLSGDLTLTPVSATLPAGSTVFFGPDGGGNVGGEWEYVDGLSGAPLGADEGISSSGLGLFGDPNFNGSNLQGPDAVDGGQYGITSAGDDTTTGNAAVTGGEALIKHSVKFVLSGIPESWTADENHIGSVYFQYGTALIPEPTSFVLAALGIAGAGMLLRRRS